MDNTNTKKPSTYKAVADSLAEFIANNWTYCPVSTDATVTDCACWKSDNCARCIRKHCEHLI